MIMGLILTEIVTVVLSIGIECKNLFGLFKKIADNGYVLDIDKFQEFKSNNKTNLIDKFFWNYVPVINVLNALRRNEKYKSFNDSELSKLCNHECFRKMNEKEIDMYLETPYGIFALCLPYITAQEEAIFNGKYTEKNENNDFSVDFDLNSKNGEVTLKNINIKKCSLSVNEIKENIRKTFLLQESSQIDKHNMNLRNVVEVIESKEDKKDNSPHFVAHYEIKYGDKKIERNLTSKGFEQISTLIDEDFEILNESEGPKLRLR